ncbi:MAG TPA: rRNA maturation RNase YbeY [Sulfuricurvum sp.]|nr:rRNA maturation RNase YbeY [Sulfuricurvum sp.]
MIDLDNQTDRNYNFELLERIAHTLTQQEIELILIHDDEMAHINQEFRGINKTTDVLSFPSDPFPNAPLGSIVISVDKVQSVAKELEHSEDDEISLLFIHGMLHLLGMDHETDTGEMRLEEERLIKEFNLPKSLIVRTLS